MRRGPGRAVLVAIVGLVVLLDCPSPAAHAHPSARVTIPVSGSTVTSLSSLELNFDEPLDTGISAFALVGRDASRRSLAEPAYGRDNTRVTLRPAATLEPGLYRLAYVVAGPDGHAVDGFVQFEISPDGLPHAGLWPAGLEARAMPTAADPLSGERLAGDPVLGLVLGLGAVLIALGAAYVVRSVRAGRR